jgi:hypothetical protein
VSKFGENPGIDIGTVPEDVWDLGGLYNFSVGADIDRISSSDNGDVVDIVVIGQTLDHVEIEQTVTLTGHAPAVIPIPLHRVYRMYNAGSVDLAGTVYCFVNTATTDGVPDDSSKNRAGIINGNNQTLMMIYTVPAGKTLYYTQGYVTIGRVQDTGATFSLRTRTPGGIFQVKRRISLNSGASSIWLADYEVPRGISEKTDVVFRCESTSANNTPVNGGFEGYLKDNDI